MQIVGVAPVGASNLRSVAVGVADARPQASPAPVPAAAHLATEQRLVIETVSLPSERARIDARPEELRRRMAAARYRDHEAETKAGDGDSRHAPTARGRARGGARRGARWA